MVTSLHALKGDLKEATAGLPLAPRVPRALVPALLQLAVGDLARWPTDCREHGSAPLLSSDAPALSLLSDGGHFDPTRTCASSASAAWSARLALVESREGWAEEVEDLMAKNPRAQCRVPHGLRVIGRRSSSSDITSQWTARAPGWAGWPGAALRLVAGLLRMAPELACDTESDEIELAGMPSSGAGMLDMEPHHGAGRLVLTGAAAALVLDPDARYMSSGVRGVGGLTATRLDPTSFAATRDDGR